MNSRYIYIYIYIYIYMLCVSVDASSLNFKLQHNILASEKNNTDDYLINLKSVVCGNVKLELEDR